MDPLVIVFGLGVGVLVGLTGIGGGSLMTPLLVIFIGVKPVVAVGTDIAYGAITKTLGGYRHFRSGTVDMTLSKWLAVGSVPGSVMGVVAVEKIDALQGTGLLWGVAFALLLTATATLSRALFVRNPKERHSHRLLGRSRYYAVAIGAFLGLILGITSVGSGALIGLVLILYFRLTPHRVVGTDVFHAALMLWAAGIAHVIGGNIDYGLMGTILIGSLPGVWIGERLVHRIPAAALRPALGCVMLASGLGVLTKVDVAVPPYVIVGAPLLVGVGAYALNRSRNRADALPAP
ncbi:MAG: sulfite exporter TauE/SafE family protein [Solirubrobacteraceae bacterium]